MKKPIKSRNHSKLKQVYATLFLVLIIVLTCLLLLMIKFSHINFSDTKNSILGDAAKLSASNNKDLTISDTSDTDSPEMKDELSDNEAAAFILISNQELAALLAQSEPAFIYIGRPTCPYCARFSPILSELLVNNNRTVYYYNTKIAKEDDSRQFSALLDKLEIDGVPALIKIENGNKLAVLEDYTSPTAILDFLNQ